MKKGIFTNRWKRVDSQVSLIVAVIVILSFFFVYQFSYYITYDDMIYTLSERSNSIYNYVEKELDTITFHTLSDADDMEETAYINMHQSLSNVREATGVRYLYTAKKTEDGSYIYLVDGLPLDSDDFRKPGDLIEPEVIPELQQALQDQIVLPDDIKSTTWGEIFVSYYPIHENGEVVGVLGMEFPADHQFNAFKSIRIGTPIIAFITVISAALIAVKLFKRISNPTFQDLSNTDFLTGLKNRNAFEIDMKNIIQRGKFEGMGMIVADLDHLKQINDEYGHQKGDEYIKETAMILSACVDSKYPIYRIGGDEFNIILTKVDEEKIKEICDEIAKHSAQVSKEKNMMIEISVGYALYDQTKDQTIEHTYHRGDALMYEQKRKTKNRSE